MNDLLSSRKKRLLAIATLLVAGIVPWVAGCAASSRISTARPVGDRLSPKLNPFVHFEDGPVLFIGVDGRAAQYVKDGLIFPLGIGLANQSKGALTFSRESFVLETADGKRFPMAGVEEFNRDYDRSRSDARLSDSFREALLSRFRNYRYVDRTLFPVKGGGQTAPDSFELGRLFFTQFYGYFPIPENGIHDRQFKLLVKAKEVPETFVVTFKLD